MTAPSNDIERLQAILDAIEEMWLRLPTVPLDPKERGEDGKIGLRIIKDALKADGRRRAEAVRRAMQAAQAASRPNSLIPNNANARRELLERLVTADAKRLPERLTMAFRDGKELTDAEVESILSALEKLGFLRDAGGAE